MHREWLDSHSFFFSRSAPARHRRQRHIPEPVPLAKSAARRKERLPAPFFRQRPGRKGGLRSPAALPGAKESAASLFFPAAHAQMRAGTRNPSNFVKNRAVPP